MLERRQPAKYRFDVEADIAWARTAEPGEYCGAELLRVLGIDAAALRDSKPAYELFQWAYAATVCRQFIALEDVIVRFLAQQGEVLGDTASAAWLGEEEKKHIQLFERYAEVLGRTEPVAGAAAQLDGFIADDAGALATALDRADYPNDAAYHYVFWLKVLFFEEYTLYLDERLRAEARFVQPAWLSAHTAHRREEEQHVVTDVAYLDALAITAAERDTYSKLFVADFEANADVFLSVAAPWRLLAAHYPAVAASVGRKSLRDTKVYADVLGHRLFRRTREAAPYLQSLAVARAAAAPARPRRKVAVPGAVECFAVDAIAPPRTEPAALSPTAVWVRAIWADNLEVDAETLDPDADFVALGGDSVRAVAIHADIEARYDQLLDFEILRTCRTVNEFAVYLDRHVGPVPEPATTPDTVPPAVAHLHAAEASRDIAVVAMAGRFPGAPDLQTFWQQLEQGRDAFVPVPRDRWDADAYYDERPGIAGKVACRVGAFVDDVDQFDPEAFGLTEKHAVDTEPQQRLFLELAADVLDRGGKRGDNIGVFASTGWNTYLPRYRPDQISRLTAVGNLQNMVAARVSQVLGLRGPAFTVDAACASSLLAVHLAVQSLRNGECDAAIAGGVELLFNPQTYLSFGQAQVLSAAGACMPFSARASGFLLGEGGGAVMLRRLDDAVAAGDPIVAVVKGTAVNNDGGGYSAMSPSPEGQIDVLRKAYRDAGVDPTTVSYVEAHGTATTVGDAVELRALSAVLGGGGAAPCGVGSVKSNIGHLFSAAGIASLIKVLLCFDRRTLAPIANFDEPHPRHHFERTRFFPVARAETWFRGDTPRRAGITSLGVGGSNCHLVLEEAPPRATAGVAADAQLLRLCAPDADALRAVADGFGDYLDAHPRQSIADVCAAANRRAHRFDTRACVVATSRDELRAQLRRLRAATTARVRPKLMFVFSAPGAQHLGMGRHLFDAEAAFRDAFAACDRLLRGVFDRSLVDMLYTAPRGDSSEIDQNVVTQPLMFAFSYAMHAWLADLGIHPDGVMGHSAGEYAAACAAGVFDVETGLRLVTRRGQLMAGCEPGSMCALVADAERVQPFVAAHARELSVAAVNNPNQVVVSGRSAAVAAVAEAAEGQGIITRPLAISCAAHSPLMAPARPGLAAAFERAELRPPTIPFYSALTAGRAAAELAQADYWLDHLIGSVCFEAAVRAAAQAGYNVFVELGPSSGLSHSIQLTFPGRDSAVVPVPTNSRSEPGWAPTLRGLAALYEAGVDSSVPALGGDAGAVTLPAYPYRKRRFWAVGDTTLTAGVEAARVDAAPLSATEDRSLHDHVIWDRPIAPGAFLIEQCLTGVRQHGYRNAGLERVLISRSLDAAAFAGRNRLRFGRDDKAEPCVVLESAADNGATWTEHISARIAPAHERPAPLDLAAVRARCVDAVDVAAMYDVFENDSFRLGPSVKTARAVQRGSNEVFARLESPADVEPATRFAGLVDGAFHSLAALSMDRISGSFAFLSFSVERVDMYAPLPAVCYARVQLLGDFDIDAASLRCDVDIVDDDGAVLLRLQHVGLRRAAPERAPRPQAEIDAGEHPVDAYAVTWVDAELAAGAAVERAGRYIVLCRGGVLSPSLVSLRRRLEDAGSTVQISRLQQDAGRVPAQLDRLRPADSAVIVVDPALDQLRALAQALLRRQRPACQELTVLGRSRMNAGFLQSLAAEQPGWPCRAILVDVAAPPIDPVVLATRLQRELVAPAECLTVSYTDGRRRLPRLVPVAPGASDVTSNGFVWITGGGGGIGRALAAHLVAAGARKLLVTGRSDAAPAALVDAVEGHGGELFYARADVTDATAMAAAYASACQRFGALDSVYHLAGVVADKLVYNQDPTAAAPLLAPKVDGARVLLDCVRDSNARRIVLFSSYVTQFGRAGQSDYAAANAYLDQLAVDEPELPIVAIDWFPWAVGMAGSEAYQTAARSQDLIPLQPEPALRAMFAVLPHGNRQLVLAALQPGRSPTIEDEFQAVTWQRPHAESRPRARVRPVDPGTRSEVEQFLRAELGAVLKRDPDAVDMHQPFPSMGLESLTAVNVIRKLEDRFDLALYPTLLFEITTAAELTQYLQERLADVG